MKQISKDSLIFVFILTILNFSGPLAVFLPLPFFVFKNRFAFKILVLLSIVPVFLMWFFLPDKFSFFLSLVHYGSLVTPSLIIIYLSRFTELSVFQRVFFSSISIIIFMGIIYNISGLIFSNDFFAKIFDQIFQSGEIKDVDIEYLKYIFNVAGLGILFFSEALFFLFNLLFFSKFSEVLEDFENYKADIIIVAFTVVFIFCVNILWFFNMLNGIMLKLVIVFCFFLFFLFFVQGLSIYLYFLKKINVTGFAKALFIVLIFIYPLPAIMALMGILDFWIDFRVKINKIGGGKIV